MLVLQFVSGKAISFFFDDDRDHVIIINHVIHDCLWVVHAHTSDYNSDSIHTLRFPIPRHAKRTARTSGLGSSSSNAPVTVTSRWSIDGWMDEQKENSELPTPSPRRKTQSRAHNTCKFRPQFNCMYIPISPRRPCPRFHRIVGTGNKVIFAILF